MEESEFERQKQGLASILAEAKHGKLCGRRASIVFVDFCMGPGIFFWEDVFCLLRLSLVLNKKTCSLKRCERAANLKSRSQKKKHVTIPNPARHPRTSMRNFPATWLQGLCEFRHGRIIQFYESLEPDRCSILFCIFFVWFSEVIVADTVV